MKRRTNLPKSHSFDGKKYKLKWRKPYKAYGICEDPKSPSAERVIMVDPKMPNLEFAETLLHEGLHAELWCLDEDTVTRVAENLIKLLNRCKMITPE